MNRALLSKLWRAGGRRAQALVGRLRPLAPTLEVMAGRPNELHLETVNLCNANCVFCPYQYQERDVRTMEEAVFEKALADFVAVGGGDVFFTPIVGDALIDKQIVPRIRRARAYPQVGRIKLITNMILAHKRGIDELAESGLSLLMVSIAGFDADMYRRVYRSPKYPTVRRNVLALLEANERLGRPLEIVLGLRPDRPLDEVMAYPDMREVMAYEPTLDFTWAFTNAGGRISREELPARMRMRNSPAKREPCVQTYNGPMVRSDGKVVACSCVAAMDADPGLLLGDINEASLGSLWNSEASRRLRASFGTPELNPTCAACDMYRGLDLYRTREGRARAELSRRRGSGEIPVPDEGRAVDSLL